MRQILQEPMSLSAVWSFRLVLIGLAAALIAAIALRVDVLDGNQGVAGLMLGLGLVGFGVVLALIAGAIIWHTGNDGARFAVAAFVLGLLILIYPAYVAAKATNLPMINDISTDLVDVPPFLAVAAARPKGANPIAYGGEGLAKAQKVAYPSVKPLFIDVAPEDVDELLDDLIKDNKWFILSKTPFRGTAGEGRIEAVARTFLLGYRDDIVIRSREADGRVRIDMRSASRYGRHDLGANAKRIIDFFDQLRLAARQYNTQ